ncbi:carboxypeptidase A1 precursor [Karstenula rhodostoma CBS 690.94]|uniref:Carboxypeptidase M14A n=1 Tax=Karstenula rhodostoma CBS 690.94 TaxID=1392251 RepID=A0A9P4P884_9PLEO|nr:carboxypeptidase A1 precursor [Karstenula rhodostoma CBS 690.94]
MKFLAPLLATFGLASAAAVNSKVSYDGWKVYRVTVGDDSSKLSSVMNKLQLSTWKGKVGHSSVVDIPVPPLQTLQFESGIQGYSSLVMHEDLGASIAQEEIFETYASDFSIAAAAPPSATWFNAYHTIAEHTQWLKDLAAAYPSNTEIISAGKSLQGRDIQGIHIWGSGGKGSQKGVVWHGTVHAREWITTMTVEYAAYQLLTSTNADDASYKNKYDFYIFPIVNPDGFAYTQTNDRMWRKNRKTITTSSCVGTDINRNWPNHWSNAAGASTNPCAEDYKGQAQGDTVENKALRAQLDSVASSAQGAILYMDIHSYSQLWMYPYGYTCSGAVPNSASYASLAKGAVAALKAVHGTTFTAGPICSTIYQVSGSSVDYALENAGSNKGVKYSMTVELRDTGANGFVLPAAQIKPSGEETWAGLAYLLKNMT